MGCASPKSPLTLAAPRKSRQSAGSGGTLVASTQGGKVLLKDEKGGTATVTIADVYQSNGVIHVIDKVLLPK